MNLRVGDRIRLIRHASGTGLQRGRVGKVVSISVPGRYPIKVALENNESYGFTEEMATHWLELVEESSLFDQIIKKLASG